MARSMIGGLLANAYDPALIRVSDPDDRLRDELSKLFPVHVVRDNLECIGDADIIIAAVKPQVMQGLLESIRHQLKPVTQLLISIAAGIRIKDMMRWVDCEMPLIRVMPNTPALIGYGASVLCANQHTQPSHKKIAATVMQAVGEIAWIDNESDMDVVTGMSGSGPAYFFRLVEIMIKAAERHGLSRELSKTLVLQTALGAARLVNDSDLSVTELRKQVTSKRGTTEAALDYMENAEIETIFEGAIAAAIERSKNLASELGGK